MIQKSFSVVDDILDDVLLNITKVFYKITDLMVNDDY